MINESAVALHCKRSGHDVTKISGHLHLLHVCEKSKRKNGIELNRRAGFRNFKMRSQEWWGP